MTKISPIIISLAVLLALFRITSQSTLAQTASATGTVVIATPNGSMQTVSGQISLPAGMHYSGPLVITPTTGTVPGTFPSDDTVRIENLTIDPGIAQLNTPLDFNAAAAAVLYSANDLSDIVSLIRAGSGPNGPSSTQNQATATGSVTIKVPNGSTQSVSGEVSLSPGMYYFGPLQVQPEILWQDPITPDPNTAFIETLTVNPGFVIQDAFLGFGPIDFNAAAAFWLYQFSLFNDLSGVVSIIRAGAGEDGIGASPNRGQARATGSVVITTPNLATQSVSGEITLPPGMFYDRFFADAVLVIDPTFSGTPGTNGFLVDSLSIDPGFANDNFGQAWDFNAAAAFSLSSAGNLSDQVSIIRAGAGDNGLE